VIRLAKVDKPQILVRNAARWTQELLDEIARGGDQLALRQSKYRQPEIKDALKLVESARTVKVSRYT
jgi:hypothetical protein